MDTIDLDGFGALLEALGSRGYRVLGPVVRNGAVVYDDVRSREDFPVGWSDEQEAGSYRLRQTGGEALFDFTAGPTSWKHFLHPPALRLWRAEREGDQGFRLLDEPAANAPPFAFIGVRACDVSAIRILDRVLMGDRYVDPEYVSRREPSLVVAVNCTRAGNTCFCASMGTGPEADADFDMALTEIVDEERHIFTVVAGSERGKDLLGSIPHRESTVEEAEAARAGIEVARENMGRKVHAAGLKDLLDASRENAHWDDVAARCLSCGNCTMACPTCFCTTVEDVTDLAGVSAERRQRWDSCFTQDYSYIHGGSVRPSTGSQYRHWITHKLSSWVDQFGTFGCVGCGRCITWCPVGIDITAEVQALGREGTQPAQGGAA